MMLRLKCSPNMTFADKHHNKCKEKLKHHAPD